MATGDSESCFADDVSLHLLEEGGLVLCEGTQSLYELNTTAALIWCCLEEHPRAESAASALSDDLNLAESEILSYVRDSMDEWRDNGLLRGSDANRASLAPEKETNGTPEALGPTTRPSDIEIFENYRLADSTFGVSVASPEIQRLTHGALRQLTSAEPGQHHVSVRLLDGSYELSDGPSIIAKGITQNEIVPTLKGYIAQVALTESTYFLALHSAALQADAGSFLLVGKAGSGKSTLAAALVHEGFRYFSDDVTLLAEPDLSVRPFPMSITAKKGSWTVLAEKFPALPKAPVHLRWDKKNVRYLALEPHQLAVSEPGQSAVHNLFFVSHNEGSDGNLARVSKTEAVRRLLTNDCYVPVHMTNAYVDRLINWIQSVDTYSLSFADLDEAVDLIQSVAPV